MSALKKCLNSISFLQYIHNPQYTSCNFSGMHPYFIAKYTLDNKLPQNSKHVFEIIN